MYYKILNILNTFQLFQGILLTVSAKQAYQLEKSSKNKASNEALSSQRSAGSWPLSWLDGVCKTKTLDGELTFIEGSTEKPDNENVCIFDETSGCTGTTFCEKENFCVSCTVILIFLLSLFFQNERLNPIFSNTT